MSITGNHQESRLLESIIDDKFIPFIAGVLGGIPHGLAEFIANHSQYNTFIKDQYIEESGDFHHGNLVFIHSGLARVYYYNDNDKKIITTHIAKKDEILIDSVSFITGSDRFFVIQMVETGSVIRVSYPNLRIIFNQYSELNFLQQHLHAERERQSIYYQYLLKLPVQGRVEAFLKNNPGIAARVNNDHIANYLGTCRTRFSKAYANYRKKRAEI